MCNMSDRLVHAGAADTRLTADGSEDLKGHVSDLFHAERQEVVLSEELKGAEAQQLEHDADVTFVVKPVQHPDTGAGKREEVIHKHDASHLNKRKAAELKRGKCLCTT